MGRGSQQNCYLSNAATVETSTVLGAERMMAIVLVTVRAAATVAQSRARRQGRLLVGPQRSTVCTGPSSVPCKYLTGSRK